MTQPTPEQPPRKNPWLIVALVVAGLFGFCVVVMLPLAIYGMRKYLIRAKESEARVAVAALARGVAQCPARSRSVSSATLPLTSHPVPPTLESVRGMKYQSAPADWQGEAYTCAGFQLSTPQYFQYQWVRTSPTRGVVRAMADLDGDGKAEEKIEQEVVCKESVGCNVSEPEPR